MTHMNVVLGNEVRLEGRGIDVTLGGRTVVELAEELRVTGRVDLRGGTIEVHGRRFTVDRGTVTFPEGGDPVTPPSSQRPIGIHPTARASGSSTPGRSREASSHSAPSRLTRRTRS